jgi:hypothetical protein
MVNLRIIGIVNTYLTLISNHFRVKMPQFLEINFKLLSLASIN